MVRWSKLTIFAISLTFATIVWGSRISHNSNEDTSGSLIDTESNEAFVERDQSLGYTWDDRVEDEDDFDSVITSKPPTSNIHKSTLLIVSTLDGTISAIDADKYSGVLWKIDTGPGSLLSSSISKVELSSHGKLVRLIPSLDGGLYKFDGEAIEPIPISADSLLHETYQSADDLLITGGKEVRTYGVDARTGHLQYACSANGCQSEQAAASTSGEFIVIRRHNQVVRAIEPRSGTERWNFSVGRHEASLLHSAVFSQCKEDNKNDPDKHMDCFLNESPLDEDVIPVVTTDSMEFKVVVPDGVVCAVHPKKKGSVLWQHKFESPVVHVWQLIDGKLVPLNLFGSESIPALEEQPLNNEPLSSTHSPLLYVGIHNQQLYVQESHRLIDQLTHVAADSSQLTDQSSSVSFRLPWKPLSASSLKHIEGSANAMIGVSANTIPEENSGLPSECDNDPENTALIIRHQTDYRFNRGFYLFEDPKKSQKMKVPKISDSDNETLYDEYDEEGLWKSGVYIVPLWYYWREVLFVSVCSAFAVHLIFTLQVVNVLQRNWNQQLQVIIPAVYRIIYEKIRREQSGSSNNDVDDDTANIPLLDAIKPNPEVPVVVVSSDPTVPESVPYVSRYLTDFEPIQCLGRGGFGLVFEVRNRLDDCHYAVKRIQLPNSEEAREKVMREVKALAKLDNPHIVRYFHAWIECPPPGWQENQDAVWIDSDALTGPTTFNSGDDVSESKDTENLSSDDDDDEDELSLRNYRFENMMKPINRFNMKHQSTNGDDSSFSIVFENSSSAKSSDTKSEICQLNLTPERDVGSYSDVCQLISVEKNVAPKTNRKTDAKMFLYIQMQLCRKESLREWLRAHVSHRDLHQVLQMFNEIIRAVEYVHLQGMIHRDLKPSNIFFAPDGAIKIGDFGLVTAIAEEAYLHSPCQDHDGVIPFRRHTDQVGTQLYMSPEQIEGKPYNHKVDIYSLGLIFFELLWPLATQMEQVTVISQLRKLKFPVGFVDKYPEEVKQNYSYLYEEIERIQNREHDE